MGILLARTMMDENLVIDGWCHVNMKRILPINPISTPHKIQRSPIQQKANWQQHSWSSLKALSEIFFSSTAKSEAASTYWEREYIPI
jgi:hypothetical protein